MTIVVRVIVIGVGMHTGKAYVRTVGSWDGVNEIAVLGSAATLCPHQSLQVAARECLFSENLLSLQEFKMKAR